MMRVKQDEPFEIQPRANAALARTLKGATLAALVLSVVGIALPGDAGRSSAWGAVGVVVLAPLARVGLLGVRWVIRRDYLFAILAFGLLAIVGAGAVIAIATR